MILLKLAKHSGIADSHRFEKPLGDLECSTTLDGYLKARMEPGGAYMVAQDALGNRDRFFLEPYR